MESLLPYETILPRNRHTATVIFLHGLGHSNATWRAAMAEAIAPRLPHALWIFPQAPLRYVKRDRQDRTAWFSIDSLPPHPRDFDESGIAESMSSIERIILSQVHSGIDPKRIVLAGFSQGAAISMLTAFTSLHDLGGVACLSGWLPSQVASVSDLQHSPVFWYSPSIVDVFHPNDANLMVSRH
ncbi:hypothetical protein ONZ45_g2618 [Pleurotus djamor]|nr:hypothetical protein ONZ45_g2618 [Pleurotus djamor]